MRHLRTQRGFTFIELMMVFSTIALLAAILFPVFSRAQEKARQCSCLSNLHNISAALRMYAVENWGHLPPTNNDFGPLLYKQLPETGCLICPTLYGPKPFIQYPPPLPEQLARSRASYGYVYRAGLCDDDNPTSIVAADIFDDLHNQGANYLFLDGHGKWMREYNEGYLSGFPQAEAGAIRQLRFGLTGKAKLNAPPSPFWGYVPMTRRGFTIAELSIVIAIIAILAAILFPVFAKAREKARQTTCLSNLHNIGAACHMYALENYGHLPPANNDFSPLLYRFLPEPKCLTCPSTYGTRPSTAAASRPYSDYVYRAGLCDDDNPVSFVAADGSPWPHNGGGNFLYLDGHGKWLSQSYLEGTDLPRSEVDAIRRLRADLTGISRPNAPDTGSEE